VGAINLWSVTTPNFHISLFFPAFLNKKRPRFVTGGGGLSATEIGPIYFGNAFFFRQGNTPAITDTMVRRMIIISSEKLAFSTYSMSYLIHS